MGAEFAGKADGRHRGRVPEHVLPIGVTEIDPPTPFATPEIDADRMMRAIDRLQRSAFPSRARPGVDRTARLPTTARAKAFSNSEGTHGLSTTTKSTLQRAQSQQSGTIDQSYIGGAVKLYLPAAKTTRAAYYCHGVYDKQTEPVAGVTLGYLAPHQSTTVASPTAVKLSATRQAEIDDERTWHSYVLSKEAHADQDDAWLQLAEESGRAIASIQKPLTTNDVVEALKASGYTDILAVHCREVLGAENVDWNPETNQELVTEQVGWLVERSKINGWRDASYDVVDSTTLVEAGMIFYDEQAKASRTILNADEHGKVRICAYE